MARIIVWTIGELVEMFEARRKNQFDVNVIVTGNTGKGKSSLILKFLLRFKGFNQNKHQIYSREDNIKLLRDQTFSFCWNDELIGAGYRREHWNNLQIELIKVLTQYRCNWNVFAGALPVFFTLDKEMLKLFSMNIEITKRGEAIVHMRKEGRRYSDDPWDVKHNAKLEESWSKKAQTNPNFKIPYHKYSTYVGHLYWNDITEKQRKKYEEVRDRKKKEIAENKNAEEVQSKPFYDKLLEMILSKELDHKSLMNICLINNRNITAVRTHLNQLLRNKGVKERVKDLIITPYQVNNNNQEVSKDLEF